ncbi:MAG: phosphatidylserine decarboxylase [Clostridiales Family XIII bacterium]|jgi:phosphatidylserine decarboxylase|nr:phosphatidylserine decarboxylase [Clostridiales Family XIII bacterium]
MRAFDRKTGRVVEVAEPGSGAVRFLYGNPPGRFLLLFLCGKRFSGCRARYYASPRSRGKVEALFRACDLSGEAQGPSAYASFRDFFVRPPDWGERPLPEEAGALLAVADAKLTAYEIEPDTRITVKQSSLTAAELLRDADAAAQFAGGYALVFRLTLENNHHYVFPDGGALVKTYDIPGWLHSVQPTTGRQGRVFAENSRKASLLETEHFGPVAQVEVGALLAGRIHDLGKRAFRRGEEKGYFDLGGSAIVLLLGKGAAAIDADILEQSGRGVETLVRMNERIGVAA